MWMKFMILTTQMAILFLVSTKNPIKASLIILLSAILLFVYMFVLSGQSWVAMVATLMFTGGILIMFMILSSFHPNETPKKMNFKMATLILIPILIFSSSPSVSTSQSIGIKSFFQNITSSTVMTLIIILYFFMFLKVLEKEKTGMRLIFC